MVTRLQSRMLTRDQQAGWLAEGGKGMGNGAKFDGFRARSNNERDTILAQLASWLRRAICC